MSNFELIDDYLTNRLNEQDRKAFEQQMASDPSLLADVALQKEIIQGLKAARAAELKAMLNKVLVSAPTFYFSPLRIAAGLIGTVVLATGLYFYLDKKENLNPNQISSSLVDSIKQSEMNDVEIKEDSIATESNSSNKQPATKDTDTKSSDIDNSSTKSTVIQDKKSKPVIDLVDPTEELSRDETSPVKSGANTSTISVAKVEVDIISTERKLKSHYQFTRGRLVLYGNFDKGLYEIIEVNAQNSRSLFLYYKTFYYLLDESKVEVTPLKEITDPVLIQKLKTFRSN